MKKTFVPNLERLLDRICPANYYWNSASTSSWTTAGNWDPSGVPANGDSIVFSGNKSNVNCNLPYNRSLASIATSDDYTGTLTINTGCTLSISSFSWFTAPATLCFEGSTSIFNITADFYMESPVLSSGTPGKVNVDGANLFIRGGCSVFNANIDVGNTTAANVFKEPVDGGLSVDSGVSWNVYQGYISFENENSRDYGSNQDEITSNTSAGFTLCAISSDGVIEFEADIYAYNTAASVSLSDGGIVRFGEESTVTLSGSNGGTGPSIIASAGNIQLESYATLTATNNIVLTGTFTSYLKANDHTTITGDITTNYNYITNYGGYMDLSVYGNIDMNHGTLKLNGLSGTMITNGINCDHLFCAGDVVLGKLDLTTQDDPPNSTMYSLIDTTGTIYGSFTFDWHGREWTYHSVGTNAYPADSYYLQWN